MGGGQSGPVESRVETQPCIVRIQLNRPVRIFTAVSPRHLHTSTGAQEAIQRLQRQRRAEEEAIQRLQRQRRAQEAIQRLQRQRRAEEEAIQILQRQRRAEEKAIERLKQQRRRTLFCSSISSSMALHEHHLMLKHFFVFDSDDEGAEEEAIERLQQQRRAEEDSIKRLQQRRRAEEEAIWTLHQQRRAVEESIKRLQQQRSPMKRSRSLEIIPPDSPMKRSRSLEFLPRTSPMKRSRSLEFLPRTSPVKLSSSLEFIPPTMSELRVVLLGNSWSERSSVGNFILGETKFNTEEEPEDCQRVNGQINKKQIVLINIPDLLHPDIRDLAGHVGNIKHLSDPGPHLLLLVLQPEDFTEEQQLRLQTVLEFFSDRSFDHSLVLISTPRNESSGFMEFYRQHPPLKDMIKKCKYRFLWRKDLELPELLTRLGQVVRENSGEHV